MNNKLTIKIFLFAASLLGLYLFDQQDIKNFLFVFSGIGFWTILNDLLTKKG